MHKVHQFCKVVRASLLEKMTEFFIHAEDVQRTSLSTTPKIVDFYNELFQRLAVNYGTIDFDPRELNVDEMEDLGFIQEKMEDGIMYWIPSYLYPFIRDHSTMSVSANARVTYKTDEIIRVMHDVQGIRLGIFFKSANTY